MQKTKKAGTAVGSRLFVIEEKRTALSLCFVLFDSLQAFLDQEQGQNYQH
jgi:hypothetical protein